MPSLLHTFLTLAQVMLLVMQIPAQRKEANLAVEVCYGAKRIEAGKSFTTSHGDTITITALRFYLCDAHLPAGQNAHLIDLEESSSLFLPFFASDGKMDLLFGIDSLTHQLGPLPGDLDPVHGMYWTWQTGYIFLKLEGYHSRCSGKNHYFEYHLGGFAGRDKAFQEVTIPLPKKASALKLDLQTLLDDIQWQAYTAVMSPGPEAVRMMQTLSASFSLK